MASRVRVACAALACAAAFVATVARAAGAAAPADCAAPSPGAFVERFVPADCERCWSGDARAAPPRDALVVDWIVPAGADAPLAAAASGEAARRAGRLAAGVTTTRRTRLDAAGPALRIVDGPAWSGYIALRLVVSRGGAWRPGLRGFAALVEHVPAGNDGSAIERQLVRAVAGPLRLEELREAASVEHVRAVSVPEGSRVDRLSAVAWVETAEGRVVAAAAAPPAACR